jgi:hypothetical protein
MSIKKLQQLSDALRHKTTNVNRYSGLLAEVAFELVTADTFIAGIASSLLEESAVAQAELALLERRFLIGTDWMLPNGSTVDLRNEPELLGHAQVLEALKVECLARSANRRH